MKALPKKLLPLTVFAIAVTSFFCVRPAQAGYIVTLQQVGANVVATGSGAFNLNGLTLVDSQIIKNQALVVASGAVIQTSPTGDVNIDRYNGFTGPTSFGSGGFHLADTGSGDFVGISGTPGGFFGVPQGYVSGNALTDSMTFNNATLASLGVTPGTYVWSWGTGLANQRFTLRIRAAGVPDGGTTVSLLGCALLGLAAFRRKLSC
jgi:hypothetical protein